MDGHEHKTFRYDEPPTAVGYSNKDIYFCWLKGHREDHGCVRKSIIDDKKVIDILEDDEILLSHNISL